MRQPVLFLAHGSPTLALEGGAWGDALKALGAALPRPGAVLVVSAHWEHPGAPRLTDQARPGILHDFSGFPEDLVALDYPCSGDPLMAARLAKVLPADLDGVRPLDHGAWVPLRWLFPGAQVPVLQLSLPLPRSADFLLRMGRTLRPFRDEGLLLVASGGLVHNLRRMDWTGRAPGPEPWAEAFEGWILDALGRGEAESLSAKLPDAPHVREAVPTPEHLDPLFVALGALHEGESPASIFAGWQMGNLSLRCLAWGWPSAA